MLIFALFEKGILTLGILSLLHTDSLNSRSLISELLLLNEFKKLNYYKL